MDPLSWRHWICAAKPGRAAQKARTRYPSSHLATNHYPENRSKLLIMRGMRFSSSAVSPGAWGLPPETAKNSGRSRKSGGCTCLRFNFSGSRPPTVPARIPGAWLLAWQHRAHTALQAGPFSHHGRVWTVPAPTCSRLCVVGNRRLAGACGYSKPTASRRSARARLHVGGTDKTRPVQLRKGQFLDIPNHPLIIHQARNEKPQPNRCGLSPPGKSKAWAGCNNWGGGRIEAEPKWFLLSFPQGNALCLSAAALRRNLASSPSFQKTFSIKPAKCLRVWWGERRGSVRGQLEMVTTRMTLASRQGGAWPGSLED